jgi:hypothetical protein
MVKVRRKNVPQAAIDNLALRVREGAVPIEDLQNLAKWLDTDPTVRSGRWFKRFAKIIVCGEDDLVKTILGDRHSAIGSEVK